MQGYLVKTLPQPYADEIEGISELTGINLGEVLLYNVFYEVFTVCTSIVAQDPSGKGALQRVLCVYVCSSTGHNR